MKIHCSGIGGIGLSAYAAHAKTQGHTVSGSDKTLSEVTASLQKMGITVSSEQDGSALPDDADVLVYSEAVPDSSPERAKATSLGIPQLSYFAALGQLTKGKRLIAVCGTHGKSSTTAMAAKVFIDAGLDPNVVVGTRTADLNGSNWRAGKSDLWIVEACEYRKSFLHLDPTTILLTNVDGDHFDAFGTPDAYRAAFVEFFSHLNAEGQLIIHGSDGASVNVATSSGRHTVNADELPLPELKIPGEHMQQNARLVAALSNLYRIPQDLAASSLRAYAGSWRRMEVRGETPEGVTVIDDYAHHPVEIKATIAAMRSAYPGRRLVAVFEPHTNDRVLKLWKEFTHAFSQADVVLVTAVYDARPDRDAAKADVARFAAEIGRTSKVSCRPSGTLERTKETLGKLLEPEDILLVMGAGNSTKLASAMLL